MALHETSDTHFKVDVLEIKGLVLVDFFAPWCGPCQMLTPTLGEVADELKDIVKVVKLNIDSNPNTPSHYGVRSIPTLILFKDGKAVSTQVGLLSKRKLIEWVQSH